MRIDMITNWDIKALSDSERYFLYAESYLQTSRSVALRMREDQAERTWPHASVALMLAAHSVELFLKGALIARSPDSLAGIRGLDRHRIDMLAEAYFRVFPEEEFVFAIPFQSEYPDLTDEEIAKLKKEEPAPSILYRYPVEAPGKEWRGLQGFEPQSFIEMLVELGQAYERIRGRI
jgi:hypothetical protein